MAATVPLAKEVPPFAGTRPPFNQPARLAQYLNIS